MLADRGDLGYACSIVLQVIFPYSISQEQAPSSRLWAIRVNSRGPRAQLSGWQEETCSEALSELFEGNISVVVDLELPVDWVALCFHVLLAVGVVELDFSSTAIGDVVDEADLAFSAVVVSLVLDLVDGVSGFVLGHFSCEFLKGGITFTSSADFHFGELVIELHDHVAELAVKRKLSEDNWDIG